MARRKTTDATPGPIPTPAPAPTKVKAPTPKTRPIETWEGGKLGRGDVPPLSVLIASPDRRRAERLAGMLVAHRLNISYVRTPGELETYVAARAWDVVIAESDLAEGSSIEVLEHLSEGVRPRASVVVTPEPNAELTVRALRAGVTDVVVISAARECAERLNGALCKAQEAKRENVEEDKRVARMREFCKMVNKSRRVLRREVAGLQSELDKVRAQVDAKVKQGSLASEFATIVRQELDIEGLLRTVLEFLLPRTGPTNAAIFLPGSSGDYALGAYVNYDVPKESCEILLDHLASTLAPKFEGETGVVSLQTREQLLRRLGSDAEWLDDSGVVAMSCRDGNECLAVLVLFRDRRTPFTTTQVEMLSTVRGLFASQLSRVIKTHNRHLPKHKWDLLNDGEDDDIDLAA